MPLPRPAQQGGFGFSRFFAGSALVFLASTGLFQANQHYYYTSRLDSNTTAAASPSAGMATSARGASAAGHDPLANHSTVTPVTPLLDVFFPGLSMYTGAIQRYLHIDLNYYVPILLFLGGITFAWNYFSTYLAGQFEYYLMSQVEVRYDDEVYNMCMDWITCQPFAHNSRHFVVNTMVGSRSWTVQNMQYERRYMFDNDSDGSGCDDDDELGPGRLPSELALEEKSMTPEALMKRRRRQKKALAYTPTLGTYYFFYHRNLIVFRRSRGHERKGLLAGSQDEAITLSCFGRDPTVLKELLLEFRQAYLRRDVRKTIIYRGSNGKYSYSTPHWARCMARNPRPLSTVILDEDAKKSLIDDIADYLNPSTRRWYANRGIPYRRGYLLYGPPGTGKSSLSVSLAGHFNMSIYMVSLNGALADEETLAQLFNSLPRKCIVLLEDIDTAGLTHTREDQDDPDEESENSSSESESEEEAEATDEKKDEDSSESKKASKTKQEKHGKLSLSGLLNILDGVASQEGRLLIMTTNHIEKLDKALIRPGRIDMMVKFDRANRTMMAKLFRSIYADLEGDSVHRKPKSSKGRSSEAEIPDDLDTKHKREAEVAQRAATLAAQADEFSNAIPDYMFSPAELQGYLLKHKLNPTRALEGVKDWVVEASASKIKAEAREKRNEERIALRQERRAKRAEKQKRERREKRRLRRETKETKGEAEKTEKTEKTEKAGKSGKTAKKEDKPAARKKASKKDSSQSKNERKAKVTEAASSGSDDAANIESASASEGYDSDTDNKPKRRLTKTKRARAADKTPPSLSTTSTASAPTPGIAMTGSSSAGEPTLSSSPTLSSASSNADLSEPASDATSTTACSSPVSDVEGCVGKSPLQKAMQADAEKQNGPGSSQEASVL